MKTRNISLTPDQVSLWNKLKDSSNSDPIIYYRNDRATGDTFVGIAAILERCVNSSHQIACIASKKIYSLRFILLPMLLEMITNYYGGDITFNVNKKNIEVLFSNGSQIHFVDLDDRPSDTSFSRLWSRSYHIGLIDDSSNISDLAIRSLSSRIRENRDEYSWENKLLVNLS